MREQHSRHVMGTVFGYTHTYTYISQQGGVVPTRCKPRAPMNGEVLRFAQLSGLEEGGRTNFTGQDAHEPNSNELEYRSGAETLY
jgi:hypothetical protein